MKNEDLSEILKTSLKAEPNFRLPSDFSQKVTQSIARHEQWKTDLTDYFYLLATLLLLIILLAGSYYLADKEFLIRIVTLLKLYPVPVLFLVFILNFILLTDRVLLRLLFNRWKINQ